MKSKRRWKSWHGIFFSKSDLSMCGTKNQNTIEIRKIKFKKSETWKTASPTWIMTITSYPIGMTSRKTYRHFDFMWIKSKRPTYIHVIALVGRTPQANAAIVRAIFLDGALWLSTELSLEDSITVNQ
jgi:hypothetical protein